MLDDFRHFRLQWWERYQQRLDDFYEIWGWRFKQPSVVPGLSWGALLIWSITLIAFALFLGFPPNGDAILGLRPK